MYSCNLQKEIYYVLTVERGIYLPLILDSNKKYIRNIICGSKKLLYIRCKDSEGITDWYTFD